MSNNSLITHFYYSKWHISSRKLHNLYNSILYFSYERRVPLPRQTKCYHIRLQSSKVLRDLFTRSIDNEGFLNSGTGNISGVADDMLLHAGSC